MDRSPILRRDDYDELPSVTFYLDGTDEEADVETFDNGLYGDAGPGGQMTSLRDREPPGARKPNPGTPDGAYRDARTPGAGPLSPTERGW